MHHHSDGSHELNAPRHLSPKPLTWHVSDEAKQLLEECKRNIDASCGNLEMNVLIFDGYGKNFIKSQKCSPDAYVQLMLQLAYYR
jgi:hypothetical protein